MTQKFFERVTGKKEKEEKKEEEEEKVEEEQEVEINMNKRKVKNFVKKANILLVTFKL